MDGRSESRSARYAQEFTRAQDDFIRLVESLDDARWRLTGRNYPKQLNDEDEGRTVGVIAHHVAESQESIMNRIALVVEGRPLPPVDFRGSNARHAREHAGATRGEVLEILRRNRTAIPERIRAVPDDRLDVEFETPAGPLTVAQRIERVLIGHIRMHQGSIEAAISG